MRLLQPCAQTYSSLVGAGAAIIAQLLLPTLAMAAPTRPIAQPIEQPTAQPAVLRIGIASAPKTLNPLLAADSAGARLLHLTHPALLRYNATYQPVGNVAKNCTQPTLQQVVCMLPSGLTFTSGNALTAPAVAAWLQQVQSTARSPLSGALRGVSITAPTAHSVRFDLTSPSLGFIGTLTELPIADPASPAHGAGPYVAATDAATGAITLTPRGPSPTLQFVPLADATTRYLKLQKAELDVLQNDMPPSVVRYAAQAARAQGFTLRATPSTGYTYLALNFTNPLLALPSVREALSLSLNRPLLRKALLDNRATPATSLLPPGHAALWAAREDPYDPMSAEAVLEDTPLPDGRTLLMSENNMRLSLTLLTSTEPFSQRLAQALQAQWAAVGIEVKLASAEWGSFFSRVQNGQFDMALLTWTGEQQPAFYHRVFHSSQMPPNGLNRGRVANVNLDKLLDEMQAATDTATLTQRAQAVQQAVASLRPYLPLWRRDNVLLMGRGVQGCGLNTSGDYRGLTMCKKGE